jgi:uncharacterized protein with beta-barrel porin domain
MEKIMKRLIDFSSRFRILKGGKAVFVRSALLSSAILSIGNADVVTNYNGILTNQQSFHLPNYTGDAEEQLLPDRNFTGGVRERLYNYLLTYITPSSTGNYTISTSEGTNLSDGRNDTFLILYSSFNSQNSDQNIIVGNDDIDSLLVANRNVLSKLTDVTLLSGQTYTLAVTTWKDGTTGEVYYTVVGPDNVNVSLYNSTILSRTIAGGGQSAAQQAAKALDFINDNSSNYPQMSSSITKIITLSSDIDVAKSVESTTPQIMTTTVSALNQISSNISNVIKQRQITNLSKRFNNEDEVIHDKNLWIKSYGSLGAQKNVNGLNGFDFKSYGIGIGFDGKNKNEQLLGFGLFLTDTSIDMNNISQNSDLNSYSTLIYGLIPNIDYKTNFLYQVGYSSQKTNSTRDLFTGDIASAKYNSRMFTLDTQLVRDYQINNELLFQPLVSTTYKNSKIPSFSETGADALNLDVQKHSSNEITVGLGTIISYKLNISDKVIGNLNLGYDLINNQNSIVSSYQGANGVDFETQGINNGKKSYDAGIGYEKIIDSDKRVNTSFNQQGKGEDYKNNAININYIQKF